MDPGFALLFGIQCLIQPDVAMGDLRAFPPPQVVIRWIGVNKRARDMISARAEIDFVNPGWWWEARCQAGTAQLILDTLASAQDETNNQEWRLRSLRQLRDVLGWTDYYAGKIPCAVPLWAFPIVTDTNPPRAVPSWIPPPGWHKSVRPLLP